MFAGFTFHPGDSVRGENNQMDYLRLSSGTENRNDAQI